MSRTYRWAVFATVGKSLPRITEALFTLAAAPLLPLLHPIIGRYQSRLKEATKYGPAPVAEVEMAFSYVSQLLLTIAGAAALLILILQWGNAGSVAGTQVRRVLTAYAIGMPGFALHLGILSTLQALEGHRTAWIHKVFLSGVTVVLTVTMGVAAGWTGVALAGSMSLWLADLAGCRKLQVLGIPAYQEVRRFAVRATAGLVAFFAVNHFMLERSPPSSGLAKTGMSLTLDVLAAVTAFVLAQIVTAVLRVRPWLRTYPEVAICGWYGFGNLGDEAILDGISAELRAVFPDTQLSVLSFNPLHTAKIHPSVYTVGQIPYGWKQLVLALATGQYFEMLLVILKAHIFVLGGGGFLSDWQPEAIPTWFSKMRLAKRLGKRVVLYAIGAGPFLTDSGRDTIRREIGQLADLITVRDAKSYENITKLIRLKPVFKTLDPALRPTGEPVHSRSWSAVRPPRIGLTLTPQFHLEALWPGELKRYVALQEELVSLIFGLKSTLNCDLSLVSMQASVDVPFAEAIASRLPSGMVSITPPVDTPSGIADLLGTFDLVIGMRLHSLILSVKQGVPVAAIAYHHKVAEFMNMVGLAEYYVAVGTGGGGVKRDLDSAALLAKVISLLDHYSEVQRKMSGTVTKLDKDFRTTAEIMVSSGLL